MADAKTNPSKPKSSWRDVLPIHPAAALFPMMTPDELKTLGEDIRKQGQRVPIAVWKAQKRSRPELLDGRNRLDAMEAVGIGIRVDYEGTERDPRVRLFKHVPPDGPWWPIEIAELTGLDPYDVVLSANIHRRHLTPQQKRDLIAKVLKATPEKSDRQIAGQTKASPSTVGKVRKEMEQTGDVSNLDTRTDSKGRQQPAHKPPTPPATTQNATPESAPVRSTPDKSSPAKLIVAAHDVIIAECVVDMIARITEAAHRLDVIECVTLLERLLSIINGLLVGAKQAVENVAAGRATEPETKQPDNYPDIPEFLRGQSS